MHPIIIILLITLAVHFFTWTYVFALNRRVSLNKTYLVWVGSFICWIFMDIMMRSVWEDTSTLLLRRIMSIFWQFLGFGLVNFIYAFLNKKRDNIYYFFGLSYITFVAISFFTDLALPPNLYFNLTFVFNILFPTIYTLYTLLYTYTNSENQKYNKQIKSIIWGCVVAFILGFLGDIVVHNTWGNDVKWRIGSTVTILQAVVFLPAIIKYNFLLTPVDERAVNLFTSVEEGLIIINDKGEILNLNERAKSLLSVEKKQWKHRLIDEYLNNFAIGKVYKNYEMQLIENQNIWVSCSVSQVKEMNVLLGFIIIFRDVTDRHIAQTALAESEQKLQQTQSGAQVGNFQYDILDDEVVWSNELYRIYGIDPLEFIPSNQNFLNKIVHPEDKEYVTECIEQSIKDNVPIDYIHRIVRPDGEIRTMHCIASTEYEKGKPVAIYGTSQDVTELYNARAELRKNEKQYRNLFEGSPDGIVIHDLENIYFANSATAKMANLPSTKELIGLNPTLFFPEEERERMMSRVQSFLEGEKVDIKYDWYISNSGERLFIEAKSVLINYNGKQVLQSTLRDITERKRAEEALSESEDRYRRLVDSSPYSIVVHINDKIVFANKVAISTLTNNNNSNILGKSIWEFIHPDNINEAKERIEKVYENQTIPMVEQKIIRTDKSEIFVEIKGISITYNNQEAIQSVFRDISDRKLTEKELRESEDRYRYVIENSTDIIYNTDFEGKITFVNPVFEAISGYTESEVLGVDANEFVAPTYKEKIKEIYYDFFISHETSFVTIIPAISKFGNLIWLELNTNKIQEGKFVLGYTIIARDITLRKNAEDALVESEEKYRTLVENSTEMIYKTDLDGNYTYVNRVIVENSGFSEEEFLNMNVFDFILESYKREVRNYYARQIKDNKAIAYFELPCYNKDKEVFWIGQLSRLNVDDKGNPVGFSITARDITEKHNAETELKVSEERYRKLVESSPDGIIIYNKEGILFANEMALKLARAKNETDLIGKPVLNFIHPSNLDSIKERIEKIYAGEDLDHEHQTFLRIDGTSFHAEAKGVLITFNNKPAVQTTIRNISDRLKAEQVLKNSEQRYRELYDNAPAAYFTISKDGLIESCNARVSEILNYDIKELIGKKIFSLYADNDYGKPRAMKVFERFKQGHISLNEELQMMKKDGTSIWINLTVFPVKDSEGEIVETRSMVVDIHQRKETQRQLESNRLQMLQAQNIAQLGSWEWDLINEKYSWSDNLYDLYGVNRQAFEISEENFISLVHEDDRKYVRKTISDCLTTQIPMDYYHRTIPINDKTRTMHCNGIVISDENGNPLSMVGTAQDVTSQIEAEQALKESEKRLANAQSVAHLGNWQENHITGELYWSDECKRVLGFKENEDISHGLFWDLVHPNDVDELKEKWAYNEEIMKPYEGIFRIILKNGSVRHIREKANFKKDANGQLLLTIGTVQDITELEESRLLIEKSQKRLQEAQHLLHIGNWEFDAQTGNTFLSNECKLLFGFSINQHIENEEFWKKIHPEDHDWLLELWNNSKESLKPYKVVYRIYKDSDLRFLRESTEFTADKNGKMLKCLGTIQDITAEREAEDEIRNSREELRELSKHLQTIQEEERAFIAREIHDELGQRLTGIKMDLSWIKNKLSDENVDLFERITSLNELIDDTVKSVRKISSELHPAILDDLGLRAAIEWQVSEFEKRTEINCDMNLEENDLDFDKDQAKAIFRILQESLTNIMRHSQAKNVEINLLQANDEIGLNIKDDGVGIKHLNESAQKSFGILGMKERAYSLGGTLTILSEENKGTNINLSIPVEMEKI